MGENDLIHDRSAGVERLLEIMRRLRDPEGGCPWDIEQDFATIAPYTIEEAYEVADAIERSDWGELKGELGDLLFQSVFHAQMAEEKGLFSFQDVADTMSDKMVARHPHVFGDQSRDKSAEQQTQDWETIKAAEREARARGGVLDDVALNLPALMRADAHLHCDNAGKFQTENGRHRSPVGDAGRKVVDQIARFGEICLFQR